jgi:FAD dependent oxidoreductase TIGR03364
VAYDLAVVGAGIVGLGHALAAARRGKRVVVVDRDAQANGASVRNFGFVTVTGQGAGDCWSLARRARDIWVEIAPAAGIDILQRGLVLAGRLPESEAVIEAFLATEMGEGCMRLTAAQAQRHVPCLRPQAARFCLYSPHDVRVESRQALPLLARWLAERHGVDFRWSTSVVAVEAPRLITADGGVIEAETVIVCPGDDYTALFPERIAAYGVTRCKLQMLRVAPAVPVSLKTAVMSDLGLGRYLGYAELPEAEPLKRRLDEEMAAQPSLCDDARPLQFGQGRSPDPGRVRGGSRFSGRSRHRTLDRHLRIGAGPLAFHRQAIGRGQDRDRDLRLRRLDRFRHRRRNHR